MDPREITGRVNQEAPMLTSVEPHWLSEIQISPDGACSQTLEFTITNPVTSWIDMEARLVSTDPRWRFAPDHVHGKIGPEGTLRASVEISRPGDSLDAGLTLPQLDLGFDYLTDSARFAIPRRQLGLPFDISLLPTATQPDHERVLRLAGGGECARVPHENIALPDGPLTVEAWVHAERILKRQGLVCKTEGSEYGLYASGGELSFIVHLDGSYVYAVAPETRLTTGRWTHVAGVFDGSEVRLYIDGQLAAATPGEGQRKDCLSYTSPSPRDRTRSRMPSSA